ncbi:MAG: hypothetical protein LBG19_02640 [Prevotellaceae bacterium]|nr:hypothetical protein [Prevotellaceae bacterium]
MKKLTLKDLGLDQSNILSSDEKKKPKGGASCEFPGDYGCRSPNDADSRWW